MARKIYLETTTVDPRNSAAEIQDLLVDAGASKIMNEFEQGRLVGVLFQLCHDGNDIPFRIPVRTDKILNLLGARRNSHKTNVKDKAERIAWRQALAWIKVQIAMIDLGMVKADEVFLPYMIIYSPNTPGGRTLYGELEARGGVSQYMKALPSPKEES